MKYPLDVREAEVAKMSEASDFDLEAAKRDFKVQMEKAAEQVCRTAAAAEESMCLAAMVSEAAMLPRPGSKRILLRGEAV